MPQFDVTSPDGKTYTVTAPDGATQDDAIKYVQQNMTSIGAPSKPAADDAFTQTVRSSAADGILPSLIDNAKSLFTNAGAGAVRGAGSIGATAIRALPNALGGDTAAESAQRRADMDQALQSLTGADPASMAYRIGKLGGEVAGTAGVGGALANGVRGVAALAPAAQSVAGPLAAALETGGFRAAGATGIPGALARVVGGAGTGAAAAGMVDPKDAKAGAVIGGVLPAIAAVAGAGGNLLHSIFHGDGVSPEVAALAQKAQDLGITIPADRLVDSKPLNAMAASLNYIPLSGRAATEEAMNSQVNKALSNTFGQDSSNVTMALRKAESALGGEFDRVLKANTVNIDPQFMQDVADVATRAEKELGSDALKPITNQVSEIMDKGASGQIDGQAAYNIKRTLDRLGSGNTPAAYHALELKKALMGALDRSLGPDEAAKFALTRQQYGNMLDLQKLAPNGADGEVSIARLANMKNIGNPQMQDLADIAAQFVKPREGMHGAAQRVSMGTTAAGLGGWLGGPLGAIASAGTLMGGGRMANSVLNSDAARRYMLSGALSQTAPSLLTQGLYRTAPLLADQ